MYVRHHCTRCNARVFPFDKYEQLTEAPKPTERGRVLLRSWNARSVDNRVAWCWTCKGFRPCERLGETEIRQMYIHRHGVIVREPEARRRKAS